MKRAENVNKSGDSSVCCNLCKKKLKVENGILKEDAFQATKEWGYFSEKDMEVHQFILCEECYDKIIKEFQIPVAIKDKSEAL